MTAIDPASHLGHYEIRSQLGAGGMGEVYLAHDTRLGRSVALKLLPPECTRDKNKLHRFQREARAASALNHPNILTIFEIGEVNGVYFIATELIEGETLKQRMTLKQITLHEALEIATQASSALASAHRAGIIHRDIKPDNIMLRNDGYVKILDFGLAKLTEPETIQTEASTLVDTQPGIVLGTMHYMSPEQARGLKADPRTDIWSLGIVIYEMVSGRMPFEGATATDVIVAILEHEPPPLTQLTRELPDELEWIVRKALRKDRDERYQTAKELLTDLKSLKQRLEFEARLEQSKPPQVPSGDRWEANRRGSGQTTQHLAVSTADFKARRSPSSAEYVITEIKKRKNGIVAFAAAMVLILMIGLLGIYRFALHKDSAKVTTSLESIKITRVTSSGRASRAAISPDGKYVVQVANENGQQSLRLRQLNTASDLQIVPPADIQYTGLTFSPGGDFIYYVASDQNPSTNTLYRIPVLGGSPRKLISNVDSSVTVSPDAQQLAFIRDFPSQGEQGLIVVKADGSDERRLASRKLPNFFQSVSWSPSGRVLACAAGSFVPNYNSYVVEVQLDTGKEKPISSQTWLFMGQVAWLADGSGLILDASEQGASSFDSNHIWYVSYPGGEVHRLTADLNNYSSVSLTADSSRFVAVQSGTSSNIWVAPSADVARATQITGGAVRDGWNGLAWTTDDKIIYASKASGNDDLWITNQDGRNQSQLTAGAHLNWQPAVSKDGHYILFTSDRAGTPNIWRMDTDGSNPKQLTSGSGENLAQCSPDGTWVLYTLIGAGKPTLWRVSINGGAPQQLTEKFTSSPAISPDGKLVACFYRDDQPNSAIKIALLPFEGGEPIKLFDTSASIGQLIRWSADGRAVTYIVTSGGISNIWSQPIDGGTPKQLTNFRSDQIFWFDWSRDGKQLAVARGSVTSDVVLISDFR